MAKKIDFILIDKKNKKEFLYMIFDDDSIEYVRLNENDKRDLFYFIDNISMNHRHKWKKIVGIFYSYIRKIKNK